jgi:hypothetical protein
MRLDSPFSNLALGQLFESLLPDFVLGFTFFTALTYAVLARRFGQQRPAIAMSAAVGVALASGLVWWEYENGWSVRNLGPLAVGFAVILLAMIMFQGIKQTGGSWSGAFIAFGASILVAWVLGLRWPVADGIIQTLAVVGLIGGIVFFVAHTRGHSPPGHFIPAATGPELNQVRHDMRDLYEDEHVGDRIDGFLTNLRRRTDVFVQHPDDAPNILAQLRRVLPAEGWLTERMAHLRELAHNVRKGHLQRIDELRHIMDKLPPDAHKTAADELAARYEELKLDKRLERLDWAVAEVEQRVRRLTQDAERAVAQYDYRKVNELLENAEKLQAHNQRLFKLIDRTEDKLAKTARDLAKKFGGDDEK